MRLFLIILTIISLVPIAQAGTRVDWDALRDPKASQFEDPFAALSLRELRSLGTVLRLRQRLSKSDVSAETRPQIEQRLENEEAKLAVSGVDTDGLLAQRQAIARKRAKAALAGNPALADRDVEITGYVIPVLEEDGSARSGYLVPEYGMCSHMPAPDPNQMIRYHLNSDWQADKIYQRVVLSGRLGLELTRQTINLLDGEVDMIAAFEMEVSSVRAHKGPVNPNFDRTLQSYPVHQ
ncbi:MAG: DUF3299 domain-containing protein [Roseibium sp.]|uniref:DUF3299 domain-containing protein n=1 Tax=Roseibium sp. TaxID=1936156 RepID=UPI0026231F16|nr:DUF3299 domain-containing protein [Roseibium sp.]MCV0427651.1 DUF3299 domain-containing protein [Roseibium sp.]